MEQLSSCYFCGTALDEPPETYLLGGDDPNGRVTLCLACHEKLETVLGAAGVDPGVLSDEEASWPASPAEATGDEQAEAGAPGQADAESEDKATEKRIIETDAGREDVEQTKRDEEAVPVETDADDILVDLGESEDLEGDAGEAETEASADTGDATGSTESTEPASETAAETDNGSDADGSRGDQAGSEPPEQAVSSQQYNKVIRLLQNREFPVERREIITVATSAYGLRESECEQVIGRAVDRGIIEEDDEGRLVRPE